MKVLVGLGNPGVQYDATRHNVGWWVLDRLAYDWDFPSFVKEGNALITEGQGGEARVRLLKPDTFMNRSGRALTSLALLSGFDSRRDLLMIVDDAALEVGRIRFRPRGSAGGHNGLTSIEEALGHNEYHRLRIGVGRVPEGVEMRDWVLSDLPPADEEVVVGLLPSLTKAVEVWLSEGIEAVMNRYNG